MIIGISLSIGVFPLKDQVVEILRVLDKSNVQGFVVLAGHSILDPVGSSEAESIASLMPNKVFLAIARNGTWSAGYLKGMQIALEQDADFVISMDADGSHNIQDLTRFVIELSTHDVVTGSRFMRNAQNNYPLQRQIISLVGTLLTKTLLTRYSLTDFTSGFEGIRSSLLKKVFDQYPPERWVSVKYGPYHLQNTELRLALIDAGLTIFEIPIKYGNNKKGKTFGFKFMLQVALGFLILISKRKRMRLVLKNIVTRGT